MKFHFSRKQLIIPYGLFLALFVVLPLLFIVYYAFTDGSTGAFTLSNFGKFLTSGTSLSTLLLSVGVAILTTLVCLLIAYPIAYVLARSKMKKKTVLLMLFVLPMWINFVLRINALREFLDLIGLLGNANLFNTVLGMIYDFLPFMILPLYTTLIKMDKNLLEASSDLGGNAFTTFIKVTLPMSMQGIISGITMVFMPTMTNYVISDTLGLGHVTIIGKLIEDCFGARADWNLGSAIALILLVIIFATMVFTGGFKDDEAGARGAGLW
jgi:spermidine/putrescine transport system permease protein